MTVVHGKKVEEGEKIRMGTNELMQNEITVYPNPSNGVFTVETQQASVLEVFDFSGRKISEKKVEGKILMNENLSTGVYILKFTSGNGIVVKKLIVR